MLQPGAGWSATVALNDAHHERRLKPGTYEVSVTYYAFSQRLLKDMPEDVPSNVVTIVIEE